MASVTDPRAGSPSPAEPPPRLPESRYRVLEPLGRGGMGEVFLAEDVVLRRKVAVKRVRAEYEHDRERLRRLLSEAHHVSRLLDPHVAALFDVIEIDPPDFVLVMEYVPGKSLRERMRESIPLSEFWEIAIQCVEAVDVIHRNGYIHRDLKPENFMITPTGQVKVLDLGLSVRSPHGAVTGGSTLSIDAPDVAGTPPYMAPEAWNGDEADFPVDIFALGVVFYEMLAGRRPFEGETRKDIREKILHAEIVSARRAGANVPESLDRLLAATLHKDPRRRPPSAAALLEDLMAARRGEYGPARGDTTQRIGRPHRSRRLLVSALAVALAAAGSWVVVPEAQLRVREVLGLVSLPEPRRVAFLPGTSGDDEHLAAFGLGLTDLLATQFNRPEQDQGLRITPMRQVHRRHVNSPGNSMVETGSNLAFGTHVTQKGPRLEARLTLWDARRSRVLERRVVSGTQTDPGAFVKHIVEASGSMLGSSVRPAILALADVPSGVFWFWLEGRGYLADSPDSADARLALDHFERSAHADSKFGPAWIGAGLASLTLYECTADSSWLTLAGSATAAALDLDPDSPEARFARARWHQARGEWGEAITGFEQVVEADPYCDEAYTRLADAYLTSGRPEAAERTIREAALTSPHSYQRWWNLAFYYRSLERMAEAEEAYSRMVAASPDFYGGYQGLGAVLVREGRYAEAVRIIERGIELKAEKNSYSNLATAYFNQRNFDQAIRIYLDAIALGYEDLLLWMNLADAYYCSPTMQNRAEAAYRTGIALGLEALRKSPKDAITLARMADAYARIGEPDSAAAFLSRSASLDPDTGEVYEWLALTYWRLGRLEEGRAAISSALRYGVPAFWIRDSALFDPMREDPGFQELLADDAAGPRPAPPPEQHTGG